MKYIISALISLFSLQAFAQYEQSNFYGVQDSTDIGGKISNPVTRQPDSDCSASAINWHSGGYTCQGVATSCPATSSNPMGFCDVAAGGFVLVEDFTGKGSVQVQCNGASGGLEVISGTEDCSTEPVCPSQVMTWTDGAGNTCSATAPTTQASNSTTLDSTLTGYEGKATFECGYNGIEPVFIEQAGSTCIKKEICPAGAVFNFTGSYGAVCQFIANSSGAMNEVITVPSNPNGAGTTTGLTYSGQGNLQCGASGWFINNIVSTCTAYCNATHATWANQEGQPASSFCTAPVPTAEFSIYNNQLMAGITRAIDNEITDGVGNNFSGESYYICSEISPNNYAYQHYYDGSCYHSPNSH